MTEISLIAFWLICLYLAEKRHHRQFGEYLYNDKEVGIIVCGLAPLYLLIALFTKKEDHLQ